MTGPDPFTALGLPARPDLTDEEVRAAWRRLAAATHPDRPDGGDPARYAAASAAYASLRTPWQRGEAYADLAAPSPPPAPTAAHTGPRKHAAAVGASARMLPARAWRGRPLRLAARVVAAMMLISLAVHSRAGAPAVAGAVTGLVIWLVLTSRGDLAPPPGR